MAVTWRFYSFVLFLKQRPNKPKLSIKNWFKLDGSPQIGKTVGVVIRDDSVRNAKPGDDVFLDEVLHLSCSDVDEGFCNPLREVICGGDKVLELAGGSWEHADDVKPPLCEGPQTGDWVKGERGLMEDRGVLLESLAFLHILLG